MAITLVMEDGTGGNLAANTYADLPTALAYHATSIYSNGFYGGTVWNALSADIQSLALVTASRTLDAEMQFFGSVVNQNQPLCWPRSWARDPDKAEAILPAPAISLFGPYWAYQQVPQPVINATCELAWWITRSDRTTEYYEGVTQFNLGQGAVSATIDRKDRPPPIPDYVGAMLRRCGTRLSPLGVGNKTTQRAVRRG